MAADRGADLAPRSRAPGSRHRRRGRGPLRQEDVGNNQRLGRVYVYNLDDGGPLVQVAAHNPRFFSGSTATNPSFLTADEESSGVIDAASMLGDGWFLMTSQSHALLADPELVEGGQLLGLYIDPAIAGEPAGTCDGDDDDDD